MKIDHLMGWTIAIGAHRFITASSFSYTTVVMGWVAVRPWHRWFGIVGGINLL